MRTRPTKLKGLPVVADQRFVRHTGTTRSIVREIMFLFGVENVSASKLEKAEKLVADKWVEGFKCGRAMQKLKPALLKKIKTILRGKESVPNE